MSYLLNRYLNKISSSTFLRSPADGSNVGGSGSQGADGGTDESKNGGQDGGDGGEDDVPDLLADDESEEPGFKVELGDEEDDSEDLGNPEHPNNKAGATLGATLKSRIESFSIKEEDIPDDIDFSNKASVAKFATGIQKRAIATAIELTGPVIQHAMQTAVTVMQQQMRSQMKLGGKQQKIQEAFNSLGIENTQDRSLAKQFFQRALDQGMDANKAKNATVKALAALGKSVNPKKGESSSNKNTGFKQGKDALDDLFN